jgi:hydrogenase 3 maturation protease
MDLLVMCIGNRDGGDDAVGPYIADKLKNTNINVLDCGTIPENYTFDVRKSNPDLVVIVDAVEMNLNPGEIRIIPKEKIGVAHISTHGIPISVLIKYLERSIKEIIFIGIQPVKMSGKMSEIVKRSADELVKIIESKDFFSQLEKL